MMKHHFLISLFLTFLTLPSFAQLTCDYIDPVCQKARELMSQGQYEQALRGLEKAKSDPGIRNCSDVYKIDNLITQIQKKQATPVSQIRTYTVNGVSFKMIAVDGGSFDMGSNSGFDDERPVHRVTLSDYSIGETEVTQALWKAVMGNNPSYFKGDNLPVEQVSWEDCQAFIRKLNAVTEGQRLEGREFRLPTEAEWEFAARGGNKSNHTQYAGSSILDYVAWYSDNSNHCTHPVAQKASNELGLYDMSGNVWEWCYDWFDENYYSKSPSTSPLNDVEGPSRVDRGGSWVDFAEYCRVANRVNAPVISYDTLGLRLAL